MTWRPIEEAPSGVAVLIHYRNAYDKSRVIKAEFFARFTRESDSENEGDGVDEWDEANDRHTYCEGWWELIDNWGDFGFVKVNEGEPTHWMPLPEPPNE